MAKIMAVRVPTINDFPFLCRYHNQTLINYWDHDLLIAAQCNSSAKNCSVVGLFETKNTIIGIWHMQLSFHSKVLICFLGLELSPYVCNIL